MSSFRSEKPFAKRSLGQNFLVDEGVIARIVDALDLRAEDTIVEIGPGRGALTERLIDKAGEVIGIELDRDLVPMLQEKFREATNFRLLEADALTIDLADITSGRKSTKLAANLPYYISTAILQRLIEQREVFSELVLMFQREVVDRITAAPGNSDRGYLTVLVENAFEITRLFDVPPAAFRPVPKVWSSVVCLIPKESEIEDQQLFRDIVSASFAHKRKTLLNNLKNAPVGNAESLLEECGIDPKRRAETLTIDEWKHVVKRIEERHAV